MVNPWIWLAILLVDYLLIVYSKIVARVIVYPLSKLAWISTHGASRLNLMKHNETVLFYALLDICFFLCNETTGKFILKQLDYSPSLSTSDSVDSAAPRWLTARRKLGLVV